MANFCSISTIYVATLTCVPRRTVWDGRLGSHRQRGRVPERAAFPRGPAAPPRDISWPAVAGAPPTRPAAGGPAAGYLVAGDGGVPADEHAVGGSPASGRRAWPGSAAPASAGCYGERRR